MSTFPILSSLLEDISIDDDRMWGPDSADYEVRSTDKSIKALALLKPTKVPTASWHPLPVKFPIDGYTLLWKQQADKRFTVALLDVSGDEPITALSLDVMPTSEVVLGKTISGVITQLLSASHDYRGKGLAPLVYKSLVDAGQVLFSSDSQTMGGVNTWRKLIGMVNPKHVFAIVAEMEGQDLLDRVGQTLPKSPRYLVSGTYDQLGDIVYGDEDTQWVIIPHKLPANFAIQL